MRRLRAKSSSLLPPVAGLVEPNPVAMSLSEGMPARAKAFNTDMARAMDNSLLSPKIGDRIGRMSVWPSMRSTQSTSSGRLSTVALITSLKLANSRWPFSFNSALADGNRSSDPKTKRSPLISIPGTDLTAWRTRPKNLSDIGQAHSPSGRVLG
jgi:hypothetical protein